MSDKPVTGPFPITVGSIPTGVTLDLSRFVESVVTDVVAALLDERNDYLERVDELLEARPVDPHVIQRAGDLPVEQLVHDLVKNEISTSVPVYGDQVLRLAERLRLLAQPKAVPAQREGSQGGAAA